MRTHKKFQFKHYYWGDDFEEYRPDDFGTAFDAEQAAENIVEYLHNQDPCDPSKLDETVVIKNEDGTIQSFNVSAYINVTFSAYETTPKSAT